MNRLAGWRVRQVAVLPYCTLRTCGCPLCPCVRLVEWRRPRGRPVPSPDSVDRPAAAGPAAAGPAAAPPHESPGAVG